MNRSNINHNHSTYINSPEIEFTTGSAIWKYESYPIFYEQKIINTSYSNRWEDPFFYFTADKSGLAYISFGITGMAERSYWREYKIKSIANNWFGIQIQSGWSFVEVDKITNTKLSGLFDWHANEFSFYDGELKLKTGITYMTETNHWGWTGEGMSLLYTGPDDNTTYWFTGQIFVANTHKYGIEHYVSANTMMANLYDGSSALGNGTINNAYALDAASRGASRNYSANGIKEAILKNNVTIEVY